MTKAKTDQYGLTVIEHPLIKRVSGDGVYLVGDRVTARDVVQAVDRDGTIMIISSDGSKAYMCVVYGEEPFDQYFLCTRSDIIADLPDPADPEAVAAWLDRQ